MSQRRNVFKRFVSRTTDEQGLVKAGRKSGLLLLVVGGRKDKVADTDEVLTILEGWMALKVVVFPGGGHVLWVHQPEEF